VRIRVPKDGSCLVCVFASLLPFLLFPDVLIVQFRVVSEHVFFSQFYHQKVRQQCVEYMRLNQVHFEPFISLEESQSYQDYLHRMLQVRVFLYSELLLILIDNRIRVGEEITSCKPCLCCIGITFCCDFDFACLHDNLTQIVILVLFYVRTKDEYRYFQFE
jgi:hypothetical protein